MDLSIISIIISSLTMVVSGIVSIFSRIKRCKSCCCSATFNDNDDKE